MRVDASSRVSASTGGTLYANCIQKAEIKMSDNEEDLALIGLYLISESKNILDEEECGYTVILLPFC